MEINKEFQFFLQANEEPPATLKNHILDLIQQQLQPTLSHTLKKFAGLQALAGIITLSICPQYGIGPLGGGHGITHFFMSYGVYACAAFCGAFFLGAGTLFATYFLSVEEWRLLSAKKRVLFPALSLAYLGMFLLLARVFSLYSMFATWDSQALWWFAGLCISSAIFSLRPYLPGFAR